MLLDLFDTPIIPGLSSTPDFLSKAEERQLIARIEGEGLTPFRFHEWTGRRMTHSYGWKYDFQSESLSRSADLPSWLVPLRDRAAHHAGLSPEAIVQALLIRYDAGAGIGWHKDRQIYRDVIGISLGNPAAMRFRRRVGTSWKRASAPLEARCVTIGSTVSRLSNGRATRSRCAASRNGAGGSRCGSGLSAECRSVVAAVALTLCGLGLGVLLHILREGPADIVGLLELALVVTPDVTLVRASIDQFAFRHDFLRGWRETRTSK